MWCWRGYLSGARCRLAYGPADATLCLLLQYNQDGFYLSVPAYPGSPGQRADKRMLCVCVCVVLCSIKWMSVVLTGRRSFATFLCWLPGLCRTGCACTHQRTQQKCRNSSLLPRDCQGHSAFSGLDHARSFYRQLFIKFLYMPMENVTFLNLS